MVRFFGKKKKVTTTSNIPEAQELMRLMQEMFEDLGLPESERKRMLELNSLRKWQYLVAYKRMKPALKIKKSATNTNSVHTSPQYFADGLKLEPTKELLTALRVRLGSHTLVWLKDFLQMNGAPLLLQVLQQNLQVQPPTPESLHKQALSVHSLKLLMNALPGLDAVVSTPDSIACIALSLDTTHTKTKIMVLEMLAALVMVHEDGHRLVVAAFEQFKELKREKKPFQSLVECVKPGSNIQLQIASLQLINTLVSIIDDKDQRIKMRNHFKRLGIQRMMQDLKDVAKEEPDLSTQIDAFMNESRWDEDGLLEQALDGPLESDVVQLGRKIKDLIKDKAALGQPVITILNLLAKLAGDDDVMDEGGLRNIQLVEKLLQKIVLNKQGIDWEDPELLEHVMAGNGHSSEKVVLLQKEIEELKKNKKRKEAQLREKDMLLAKLAKKLKAGGRGSGTGDGDGEGDGEGSGTGKGKGKGKGGDDADKTKDEAGAAKEKEKISMEEKKKALQLKTAPLPFNKEEIDASSSEPSAPIVLPPGVPPPPPPPGMKAPATPERCPRPPTIKMKGLQWTKMRTRQVHGTFWTQVNFKRYETLPWEEIEELFAAVVVEAKPKETGRKHGVTIIDPKRAQNIAIMLSRFKCSIKDISQALLTLDSTLLDLETVTQLAKYVPVQEELDLIKNFLKEQDEKPDDEQSTLGKAEIYFREIARIPKLAQRIELLHFKLQFPEKLYSVKPDVRKIFLALKEIHESSLLFSVMEFTLLLGNFINFGTFRGNASGYRIEGLNRMADTRSSKRQKFNLVHYVAQWIERERPELLKFPEEIPDVFEAATLCFSSLAGDVRELRKGLTEMEKTLDDIPSGGSDDVFAEVMSTFLVTAKEELEDAEQLIAQTEAKFGVCLKHYAEENKNGGGPMQPEEFIAIFKRFAATFEIARKDLETERVMQEKAAKREIDRKARLAKMREVKKTNRAAGSSAAASARLRTVTPALQTPAVTPGPVKKANAGEDDSSDEDSYDGEDTELMDFIRNAVGDVDDTGHDDDDGEGVMDDVLAMIRDGDFRKGQVRSNSSSNLNNQGQRIEPPKRETSKLAVMAETFSDDDEGLMSDEEVIAGGD